MEAAHEGPEATVRRPNRIELVAGALLLATLVLHIVAMAPAYFHGAGSGGSLFSQTDQAALYSVLAAGWALALIVGLTGPGRMPLSAGLAVGLAVTELGFRVSDLGDVFRYGSSQAGPGLWIMTAGWFVGAAAAIAAVIAAKKRSAPDLGAAESSDLPANRGAWTALVAVLGLAIAGAFLPAWDHYRGVSGVTGRAVSFNLGNAFANPWQITVGNVIAAIAFVVVPVAALRLRDRAVGAALVGGGLIVLASQFTAAVVQVDQPVPLALAGLSAAQARQLGFVINMNLTGWFTLDALAAFALLGAVFVWATARADHVNSPGILPSAPDVRSAAIPSPS